MREALRRSRGDEAFAAEMLLESTAARTGSARTPSLERAVSFSVSPQEGTPPLVGSRTSSASSGRRRTSAYKRQQQQAGTSPKRDRAITARGATQAEQDGCDNQQERAEGSEPGWMAELKTPVAFTVLVGLGCWVAWSWISPLLRHDCVYTGACLPTLSPLELGVAEAGVRAHAGMRTVAERATAFVAAEALKRCSFRSDFADGATWDDEPRACAAAWKARHDEFYQELRDTRAATGSHAFDAILLLPLLAPLYWILRLLFLAWDGSIGLPKMNKWLFSALMYLCCLPNKASASDDDGAHSKAQDEERLSPGPRSCTKRRRPEEVAGTIPLEPEPDPEPPKRAEIVRVVFDQPGPLGIVLLQEEANGRKLLDEVKPHGAGASKGLLAVGQELLRVDGKAVRRTDSLERVLARLRSAERPLVLEFSPSAVSSEAKAVAATRAGRGLDRAFEQVAHGGSGAGADRTDGARSAGSAAAVAAAAPPEASNPPARSCRSGCLRACRTLLVAALVLLLLPAVMWMLWIDDVCSQLEDGGKKRPLFEPSYTTFQVKLIILPR